ncbi:AEC family transporter [Evansella cellulosilytica]|uniref:Auxin Efflux Carrier n=1 Tax=Evansella cellulosilytica (strain ATCC 21833 / DSM 2522 / FERM P-1141 / JCM 9156 / N-4) TaxID=649639 RepID=E6U1V8_EVAC2|nr:AEC family transporter [Evansella cellulosilytica]ADU31605.1 Auxin Efflux Carrier [Evansella cellulosilytica DSM 2522]
MNIFTSVVLPVLLVFLLGFVVQKWKKVEIKPISTVAIYLMVPALVFRTFYTAELNIQYVYMIIFALVLLFSLILINKVYCRLMKYPVELESGLILSTAFKNAGNYGAPIILFAYGEVGFAFAVSYMVLQSIIMNVFGVYYASKGSAGMKSSVMAVLHMPATYAVLLALLLRYVPFQLPGNLFLTIDIIAEATIPTVMIILGMQLAKIKLGQFQWGHISYAVTVRLFISPLIAFFITLVLPMDPLLAKVLIVSAAMPSAATIVMYAIEFNAKPKLVSSVTLISTLLSILTITILLLLLQ